MELSALDVARFYNKNHASDGRFTTAGRGRTARGRAADRAAEREAGEYIQQRRARDAAKAAAMTEASRVAIEATKHMAAAKAADVAKQASLGRSARGQSADRKAEMEADDYLRQRAARRRVPTTRYADKSDDELRELRVGLLAKGRRRTYRESQMIRDIGREQDRRKVPSPDNPYLHPENFR